MMGWLAWLAGKTAPEPVPERRDIALFPLNAVLFPGGALSVKVFETHYLDMIRASTKTGEDFGICLIARGFQSDGVGEEGIASSHKIGALARITACDGEETGSSGDPLHLNVQGGARFRILERRTLENGLLRAEVELLRESEIPVPPSQQRLLPLLRGLLAEGLPVPEPHRWESAAWVGYRLCEIVPVQALAKQKLLELDDPVSRLEILERYLEQHGLLS
ncbi:MAG: LON peptidase substrate-binding domain-containing protein [Betaproteobacteria bacterium]|nr:LON peptidase substrate-binding domain-containing protein [Betaproteobacteria bacterium]